MIASCLSLPLALLSMLVLPSWANTPAMTAATFIETVKSNDVEKADAVNEWFENAGPAAVPVLSEVLETGDASASFSAALMLTRAGKPGGDALIRALKLSNKESRSLALRMLKDMIEHGKDVDSEAAIAALKRIAADDKEVEAVRSDARRAIEDLGAPKIGGLRIPNRAKAPTLNVSDDKGYAKAASQGPADLPKLIEALSDDDDEARAATAQALGILGSAAKDAIPSLIIALSNNELRRGMSRYRIAGALGRMGPEAEPAIPALIKELNSERRSQPRYVGEQIAKIGAKAVVPLIASLQDADASTRLGAVTALGDIGPPAKAAVPGLIQLLEDTDLYIPDEAAVALGKIGPSAGPALVAMSEFLNRSADPTEVALAILEINPAASKEALPALVASLRPDSPMPRAQHHEKVQPWERQRFKEILTSLAQLGAVARPAIPGLIWIFEHDPWGRIHREPVATTMLAIDSSSRDVRAVLCKSIRGPEIQRKSPDEEIARGWSLRRGTDLQERRTLGALLQRSAITCD